MSRRGLRKLEAGEVDATLLALAGLKRLGLADKATALLDDAGVPARGRAGRDHDRGARRRCAHARRCWRRIDHADTSVALAAERAFLAVLDGSCRTPIAGHAVLDGDAMRFRGMILRPDGSETFETSRAGKRAGCRGARRGCGRGARSAARRPISSARDMRLLVTRPEPDAARTAQALARARARGRWSRRCCALQTIDGGFRRAVRGRADDQRERGARAGDASRARRAHAAALPSRSARAPPRPRARPASPQVESADGALADLVRLVAARFGRRSAAALPRGRGPRRRSRRRSCGPRHRGRDRGDLPRGRRPRRFRPMPSQALRTGSSTPCCTTRAAAPRRCCASPSRRGAS